MPALPVTEQITFLYTRDLAATAHFYEEILQLPVALIQPAANGACRIYKVCNGAYVGFCERASAPEKPQGILFTLVTPDVDAWAAHLRAHHVPFEQAPALNAAYHIYHCFVRDPNGYLIEIQRFLDPAWDAARPATE